MSPQRLDIRPIIGVLAVLALLLAVAGTVAGSGLMSMIRYDADLANHQRIIDAYDRYWRDTRRPPETLADLVAAKYLPVRSRNYASPDFPAAELDYRDSVYELVPSQAYECRVQGYCVRRVAGREQGFHSRYVEASRPIPGECGREWCKDASDVRAAGQ